jgi:hypothetical protein
MMYSLKQEQLISLYLSRVIPISEIRYLIINHKNKMETEETLDYHMERWLLIGCSHYTTHDTHFGKFSIIHDSTNYVVKPDHRLDFYNATGISYQIVELVRELIKRHYFILPVRGLLSFPALNGHFKNFLKADDKLYSQLANLIMEKMKE